MTEQVTAEQKPYVPIAQMGHCRVCAVHQDLRCGVCFTCADRVKGERVSAKTHRLWDVQNPSNVWFYSEDHN